MKPTAHPDISCKSDSYTVIPTDREVREGASNPVGDNQFYSSSQKRKVSLLINAITTVALMFYFSKTSYQGKHSSK